jgi:hypothetical protein
LAAASALGAAAGGGGALAGFATGSEALVARAASVCAQAALSTQ